MRSLSELCEGLIPLDSELASLSVAGGKGMNLSRLLRWGFPVPRGFILTTHAYASFVANHGLAAQIDDALAGLTADADSTPASLDAASRTVARLFRAQLLDESLVSDIRGAYDDLGRPAVAVRSSATAEDLPELSFAGQQETFLNVVGDEQLLAAIVDCWASLWTPRAIAYRLRNDVTPGGIAVVVQEMVASDAAGVMFTAHPLSGDRSRIVIEAARGLGESLVSGRVEPDRFTVEAGRSKILERFLGAKRVAIIARDGGGTLENIDESAGESASIGDETVLELARLGRLVASHFGVPQDIEWALAKGGLHLLQSRPITSLYPLPDGMRAEPLQVMFSFAAIQGILDPFTPFGADMIRQVFASASHIFGYRYTRDTQRVIATAGGRLWVNFTALLRSSFGRKVVGGGLAFLEPTIMQALRLVWDDPQLAPVEGRLRFSTLLRLFRFFGPLARNIVANLAAPRRRRDALVDRGEQILARLRASSLPPGEPRARLAALATAAGRAFDTLVPPTFIRLVSGVAAGMASLRLLDSTARRTGVAGRNESGLMADLVLEVTRGVPNNPTTEMDLALWQVAKTLRDSSAGAASSAGAQAVQNSGYHSAAQLAEWFAAGRLPPEAQSAVSGFLERYGARGLAELDTGRPRWRDEPRQVFEMLEGYLKIGDERLAPDAVFARSAAQAGSAIERLVSAARSSASGPRGAVRAARVRFAARRARTFLGFREYPKFFAVRMMDIQRSRLLEVGAELARAGHLTQADDVFFLTLSEQVELGLGNLSPESARELIATRRHDYAREMLRRRIPRLLLSDGRAFYDGLGSQPSSTGGSDRGGENGEQRLLGSPVSPGVVEGSARIVIDPRQAKLEPGEILVCRGTDPSWTPLFLIAAGLVMEVGGMMTHGAVVAREYGIPAVVGVHEATRRLSTGQRVRVDGSSGTVVVVEPQQ